VKYTGQQEWKEKTVGTASPRRYGRIGKNTGSISSIWKIGGEKGI